MSDVLLWTPSHVHASVGRPSRTYLQQLCTDTGCSLKNQPKTMDNRDEWRENVRKLGKSVLATLYIYI